MNAPLSTPRYARRMQLVKPSAIRELLRHGADPSVISFGGGYPDATLFPVPQLEQVFAEAISLHGEDALQYTVSNGSPELRNHLAARMAADGMPCTADEILILQGAQQGLDLVAKMVLDEGDVAVVEDPTFLGALIAFNPNEPRYATVRMDEAGMDTDDLARVLRDHAGAAKLLYTVPDFQNPAGVTMSLDRRRHLVELANEFDLTVIEDTPYRDIRFQGEHLPTLKSLDTEGRVVHLRSFSKILAPGMRLGWAVASAPVIEQLGLLKLAADTQCSTLNMYAATLFLDRYDIDAHIDTIRATYRRKKDLMVDTIRRELPDDVSCTDPSGGLFTWLTFPDGFDAADFMARRALPEAKVAYVPGATFFANEQRANHARFSYSTQTDERIVEGVTRLGRLLRGVSTGTDR